MSAGGPSDPRSVFEASHARWLAGYAVTEADAGGRAHNEPDHPYRTCFQRDRDRIVHCSAFRRLDFKTQVFVPHEHDHFRTRLTHTLEVAQIGRDIGRALRLNEDLVEAVALAHDLGHPPFGHAGEAALDELMSDSGGFEHNRQSLRVVDYLEHPYPDFRGLNLTSVVRECLAKHETAYDAPICDQFDSSLAGPLEGQLVDMGDEIAYSCADLEDALAAEWINQDQLTELELWRQAYEVAERAAPSARSVHKRIRAVKSTLALLADDLIATTTATVQMRGIAGVDAARRVGRKTVVLSADMAAAFEQLRQLLHEKVYSNDQSRAHAEKAGRTISQLFSRFVKIRVLPKLLDGGNRIISRIVPKEDVQSPVDCGPGKRPAWDSRLKVLGRGR